MNKATLKTYITAEKIEETNARLGAQITKDYKDVLKGDDRLLVVITLKGAALFGADLIRHLDLPITIDFVRATSYGSGTQTSGNVRILKDVETHIAGKHVLILDEIVDSGFTIDYLISMFDHKNPASLKVATLLNKPSRREVEVKIDYCGMDVEDKFLVGYGLDFKETYRNLKEIAYIED